ncbi:ATP-binding protein [Diaphorobacter aerolatus]|uniref:histidine kinase n=1 Tax=Diaphorobacter aerolatus TaxID=1288495 RepID=A0A7H0GHN7_9BURK|nr:ATP-binding protein [Diaphorobacter aerolatus]QNP47803.1 sensor histidine kinase N-terminal domain-containing protein [Diaphorobacter aerolatus]
MNRRPGHSLVPRSLGKRLLLFICAAIALTAMLQAAFAYRNALEQTDTLFDYQMQQTAFALRAGLPVDARGRAQGAPSENENHEFIVQVWTNEGLRIFESAFGAALPQNAVLGFADIPARGTLYRVFSLQTRSQVIQVAQDMRVRRKLARDAAWRSLVPIALLAPLLALAVWWVVRSSLAPMQRVRGEIASRRPQDLSPVRTDGLPEEVQPLVGELNALLLRMQHAFEAQQHFVADAAHELRSPLAALRLQVQGLQRAGDDATRAQAAARLVAGIDRATKLVEQLMVLARQEERAASGAAHEPVRLDLLAAQAVADAAPFALQRRIDLGLAQADTVTVTGQSDALRILLRNLIDNAIKYTPEGGTVDVRVQALEGQARLIVDDSGPGIPPDERADAMRRFHRTRQDGAPQVQGSGLGLAIVDTIARAHAASIALDTAPEWGGLRVMLSMPCADTAPLAATESTAGPTLGERP